MELGLSSRAYRLCLLRSGMLNFLYTEQGLQSLGFLLSILPGLRDLHKDERSFAQSCARYAGRFNCHVFWAPFLAGAFLCQERRFAAGEATPDMDDALRNTLLNALSAMGDSFFNGSLMVFLMLSLACLILLNQAAALPLLLIWLLLSLGFKWFSFHLGLARGFPFLRHIWQWKLADKAVYLKRVNAILLCVFLILLFYSPTAFGETSGEVFEKVLQGWFLPVMLLILLGGGVARLCLPRVPLICAAIAAGLFF